VEDGFVSLNRQRVIAALSRYVSSNTATGIVRGAARECGLDPDRFAEGDVNRLIEQLEMSSRFFLTDVHRAELSTELRTMSVQGGARTRVFAIRTELDVSKARLGARQLCHEAGASSLMCQQFPTCVSEVARNIVQYARVGRIELTTSDDPRRVVAARATDQGPGIANIEDVLSGAYQSSTGLGRGLAGIRRVANRFAVETGANGTCVEFEMWL
jgi:serine/threonine-protein kinase RsbT